MDDRTLRAQETDIRLPGSLLVVGAVWRHTVGRLWRATCLRERDFAAIVMASLNSRERTREMAACFLVANLCCCGIMRCAVGVLFYAGGARSMPVALGVVYMEPSLRYSDDE